MKHTHTTDSTLLHKGPCTPCGSSDANATYDDGHSYCFSCGAYGRGEGETPRTHTPKRNALMQPLTGECVGLARRKITEATCQKFGYIVATQGRTPVQAAPYYDDAGTLVAQKIRTADKQFRINGSLDDALPFGAHAWPKTGKKIVITEGEIDAMSMSQAQGNKWPVVSIASGAGPQVRKYIAKHKAYFCGFDEVVICFDMDEIGRRAAQEAAEIIGPRSRIMELPEGFKDANEMLVAGKVEDLITAMWRAKAYRPEGLVGLEDIRDKAQQAPQEGLPWPWPGLTTLTYGIQKPYIYTIGAAAGAGKTDLLHMIITHLLMVCGVHVGAFLLEEEPHTTGVRLASKVAKRLLHTPESWDAGVFNRAFDALTDADGKLHLYDSFGMSDWDTVREKIEYLHGVEGVEYFVIDHLTAFAAGAEDERKTLESIMAEMSGLATRLKITIILVSHLATPEGAPHEEGGRVQLRHFKGSRSIAFWTFGAIGMERDQQAEDIDERHTTTIRLLKARGFGWNVGKTMNLRFDPDTGLLHESYSAGTTSAGAHGFRDESQPTDNSDF
jgi:twinkle protein